MKRRRRYGEKYSGLPYPEKFKARMMALFPEDQELKEALDRGWDSVGVWFNELVSYSPGATAEEILDCLDLGKDALSGLKTDMERDLRREQELKSLSDEWQRIVYLDDQSCKPWKEENEKDCFDWGAWFHWAAPNKTTCGP